MQLVTFMEEGGFVMWVMLASAIAFGVAASRDARGPKARLQLGAAVIGAQGLFGMALGMKAVARYLADVPAPQAGPLVAVGLGELANNGILAAALVLALLLAAHAPRRPDPAARLGELPSAG